jgi:lipopolysaccharide export LptBFGC system permease protein LptF
MKAVAFALVAVVIGFAFFPRITVGVMLVWGILVYLSTAQLI